MATPTIAVVSFFFIGPERLHVWDLEKKEYCSVFAVSGGGRGQKLDVDPSEKKKLVRFPYGKDSERLFVSRDVDIKENEKKGIRGGPIPPGLYRIHHSAEHEKLKKSSFLEPDPSNEMYGRDEFFIHGQGVKGSDGCIVPGDSSVYPILILIDSLHKHYKGAIFLKVIAGKQTLIAMGTAANSKS